MQKRQQVSVSLDEHPPYGSVRRLGCGLSARLNFLFIMIIVPRCHNPLTNLPQFKGRRGEVLLTDETIRLRRMKHSSAEWRLQFRHSPMSAMPDEPISIYPGASLWMASTRPHFCAAPMTFLTLWPIAFIVWCVLWQRNGQRIAPTGTSIVTSGHRAVSGTQPPSAQVIEKWWPWRWMGWLVMLKLPMRTRTRSLRRTGSGSMPGKTRLFHVYMLKSIISETLGR